MRYFYDTEFIENGHTIDLVSIGIVAEDGRDFYAVSSEFDQRALLRNPWLVDNVWPSLPTTEPAQYRDGLPPHGHLDTDHPDVRSRAQIGNAVRTFILGPEDSDDLPYVELWADYGAYDHVVLAQLFGTMMDLPEGMPMFTHDVQQRAAYVGWSKELPTQEGGLHNALADARHVKIMVQWLDGFAPTESRA